MVKHPEELLAKLNKTHFAVEKGDVGFCGQWKFIRDNKILGH